MSVQVKAGVAVVILWTNRVLIGRRKGSHGAGLWALPGGSLEPGDLSMKARGELEVLEECRMTVNVIAPDGIRDDLFTTFDILNDDGTCVYLTAYLLAEYMHGGTFVSQFEVLAAEPEKCEGWRWVTLPELIELVQAEQGKGWIPLDKIVPYLTVLMGNQS
jgi:8-oxo-dGTP diphosphatase